MAQTLLFKGTLNGVKVIMHGEEHRSINNSYYESIKFKPKDLIFVEHSSNACEVKPEEEHLFVENAKGTEWIFYTQKKLKNPNVVCFDTRAELGYLNAFQEARLFEIADRLPTCPPKEIREFLDGIMHQIKAFNDDNEPFLTMLPGYFERSMIMLESQMKVCTNLLRIKKREEGLSDTLSQILSGVGNTLAANVRKVASISTDISLVRALLGMTSEMTSSSASSGSGSSSSSGSVHVFCGKNHVVRMALLLPFTDTNRKFRELDIELEGDLAMDKKLIAISSSSEFRL
jgi:hypothetical protein